MRSWQRRGTGWRDRVRRDRRALLLTGPIPGEWHYPNQFWVTCAIGSTTIRCTTRTCGRCRRVSGVLFELSKQPPGTLTLVEAPWRFESHFNALSLYQDVHRQRIRIGLVTPVCGTYDFGEYPEEQPGMRMRWLVHLTSLLRGETHGADYLVIHATSRDVAADPPPPWPDLHGCMPVIEAKFGPPVYRDDRITVFALNRVSPLGNTGRSVQQ